ncbi:cyclodeaminase/cyclohydrolase family protein [Desulforamulus aeronauticus]|uniref:Formimidoyltetrahydrofolate cyclodeaminase n=1 Tax=Desulforamulus aeronauticus DSM 10349 TaxID=1121421 RepID=A0A1M6PFH7_9FIRM|nr:cyclodeaminase/cyclohydrolase family protein [Desulforamulus aeronauticus]SHK06706.1 Formimidoyltetrahydrofolate cyclodeaminase [Desulforamulus aeronauticus DSM 10349]
MSISYLRWSVEELFEKSSSAAPEPGGGGVSAMSGCLGCGMLTMVARITASKVKDIDVSKEIALVISSLEQNMENLKNLAQKDMQAFQHFMDALALPNSTPEEKNLREEKKQQAALLSAEVPLEIGRNCLAALHQAKIISSLGSKLAISDVAVGAYLLEASLKGALLMVEANVPYLKDAAKVEELRKEKEMLTLAAEELGRDTLQRVKTRMQE